MEAARCGGRKEHLLLYSDDFESGLGANSTTATISEAQLTNFRKHNNFLAKCPFKKRRKLCPVKRSRHLTVKSCNTESKLSYGGFSSLVGDPYERQNLSSVCTAQFSTTQCSGYFSFSQQKV
jgi:hypothetical protein